ncbi:MAG: sigma-70 family RNA polymerase sigma factor [Wenzhouxiangellaceae bacterium]|nr:sigma-70 family RNA polymerase sigma factor [Wenzhouxiangellaceae bacterium]
MNDAEHDLLVLDAQDGSREAFEALVRHHHPGLLRYAIALSGEPALAQDAVQDGWMTAARRIRRLDDARAFRGWLYHAVRWRVLDMQRRRHRQDLSLPDDDAALPSLDEEQARERGLDLDRALERMPAVEREILQLFYLRELRIPEIAVVLDVPQGTVKSRLHRARQALKLIIEGDDHES